MAALTTQTILRTGLAPTYSAVSASDTFTPGPYTFLHVKNAGGSSDTVTITVAAGDPDPTLVIADLTVSVPATTGDRMIGPFPPQYFANSVGVATVTHSFTTSVTCAVLNLQQP